MGERTQRNLTTKVRYFVYYDFTTLNGAKSYMKSPQFAILKYFEDLKIFRRPCSWFEVTSRSWNFSKIANSLGFLPRPARPLCFLHASLHYSAGSLASLILPKKSAKFNSPWSVHCNVPTLLDHYYQMSNFIRHNNDKREDKKNVKPYFGVAAFSQNLVMTFEGGMRNPNELGPSRLQLQKVYFFFLK